jgi:aryl-alcohol dehydrogenase
VKATAAVLREHGRPPRLEAIELDGPRGHEVLVRVAGTGLCHTDLLPGDPAAGIALPLVTGHEGSGVVAEVGDAVTGLAPGDHVVMSYDFCGACHACAAGRPANCAAFFPRNLTGRRPDGAAAARDADGAEIATHWFGQSSFATHAVVAQHTLVRVPKDLPLPLLGPLGCGFQTGAGAVFTSLGVRPGASVAVAGAGAVGLAAVMAARIAGATTIAAVDLHPSRLELASELGATHVLDGSDPDLAGKLARATGGADFALDTTGAPEVITTLVRALHSYGTCGLAGVLRGELPVDPLLLATGRTLRGIIEGDAVPRIAVPRLVALWRQGRFPFDRLIRTYPLAEIERALRDTAAGTTVKAVLLPA